LLATLASPIDASKIRRAFPLRPFISLCPCRVENKKTESTNMKPQKTTIAILAALSASLALADDFKTQDGKEYKGATVTRVEPDGVVVKTKTGISKLYFAELPKDVQERFHYDSHAATAYSAAQAANGELYNQQQEEAQYRQEDAGAQKNANIAKQQAANDRAQAVQDQKLIHEQEKALQHARNADRHRSKYTTVLHSGPVVRSQASAQVKGSPPKVKTRPHQ
jgi:sRNA-binding protein